MTEQTSSLERNRCGADITLRDEEHELVRCQKFDGHVCEHAGSFGDGQIVRWTDATHG